MSLHLTAAACPWCGKPATGALNADGNTGYPEPGDLTICTGCTGPAIYDTGPLGLIERLPTIDEWVEHRELIAREQARCRQFIQHCQEEGLPL